MSWRRFMVNRTMGSFSHAITSLPPPPKEKIIASHANCSISQARVWHVWSPASLQRCHSSITSWFMLCLKFPTVPRWVLSARNSTAFLLGSKDDVSGSSYLPPPNRILPNTQRTLYSYNISDNSISPSELWQCTITVQHNSQIQSQLNLFELFNKHPLHFHALTKRFEWTSRYQNLTSPLPVKLSPCHFHLSQKDCMKHYTTIRTSSFDRNEMFPEREGCFVMRLPYGMRGRMGGRVRVPT